MDARPIPAFYCCYLLRSTLRHSSLYVGSTPNPTRRLAQHNGRIQGGAAKTSRQSLRPWEMACFVSGFPSHIAALQFEWAWQNAHLTLRIPTEQRITPAHTQLRASHKAGGRARRRPVRPRATLVDKLANLHLLLRVDSFRRWPLEVRFFCEDVHAVWERWCERVEGRIREGVRVVLEPRGVVEAEGEDETNAGTHGKAKAKRKRGAAGKSGVQGVEVDYASLQGHLEKSVRVLGQEGPLSCAVCSHRLEPASTLVTTCPHGSCEAVSHLTCLSNACLHGESTEHAEEVVLPTRGTCPGCHETAQWKDIVKELSLRMRGQDEVDRILKRAQKERDRLAKPAPKKRKKSEKDVVGDGGADRDNAGPDAESDDDVDLLVASSPVEGIPNAPDDCIYREVDDDEDDDVMSVTSAASDAPSFTAVDVDHGRDKAAPGQRLEIVIEDSEWDDAEVVD